MLYAARRMLPAQYSASELEEDRNPQVIHGAHHSQRPTAEVCAEETRSGAQCSESIKPSSVFAAATGQVL